LLIKLPEIKASKAFLHIGRVYLLFLQETHLHLKAGTSLKSCICVCNKIGWMRTLSRQQLKQAGQAVSGAKVPHGFAD